MEQNSKVKIFCIYNKNNYIFETDVITPIQVSKPNQPHKMNILQTCDGYNISDKNDNYAEMSAWYWVWKNYMPKHPKMEYIGFCHYRRFVNFCEPAKEYMLYSMPLDKFISLKNLYTADVIYEQIKNYDVILPKKIIPIDIYTVGNETIEEQYLRWHHQKDLDVIKEVVRQYYPEYYPAMLKVLNGRDSYFCLMYTMKTPLVNEFLTWAFDILFKVEKLCDWKQYKLYNDIRTPAYLMERFFNVWLEHNKQKYGLKVLERDSYLLDIPIEITSQNVHCF